MIKRRLKMTDEMGLHMRPAKTISSIAIDYPCSVNIISGEKTVNAKSILGVLSACIRYNDEFEIICDGEGEEEAMKRIVEFAESNFMI